jgi:hypothetical protein
VEKVVVSVAVVAAIISLLVDVKNAKEYLLRN